MDKKCPFTGNVSIRGRVLTGIIATMKMKNTITVRRDYLHYIKKYNRFEKRHKKLSAHMSPAFLDVQLGDQVCLLSYHQVCLHSHCAFISLAS